MNDTESLARAFVTGFVDPLLAARVARAHRSHWDEVVIVSVSRRADWPEEQRDRVPLGVRGYAVCEGANGARISAAYGDLIPRPGERWALLIGEDGVPWLEDRLAVAP